MRGSAYIDVIIEGRKLSFATPMLNYVPIKIDLDKLDEHLDKIRQMNLDEELLNQLSNLKTEEEMKNDLVEDLQKSGWEVYELDGAY